MACCALGALLIAPLLAWRRKLSGAVSASAAIAASSAAVVFAAYHVDHYAARARANERTLIAEIMAQPLCTGGIETAKTPGDNLPRGEGG